MHALLLAAALSWAQAPATDAPTAAPADAPALGIDPASVVGEPMGAPLSGAALDAEIRRVGSRLRCPVCQGLSVADSPAESAVAMRNELKELLQRGYTDTQCLDYFETSYGEFVLLEPKKTGFNWVVWGAPAAFLLVGGGVVLARVRARSQGATSAAPAIDPALVPFLKQVDDALAERRAGRS